MPITLISASLLGLLLIYLSYGVSKERLSTKTDLGDGGHASLQAAIRAQGNFIEYTPIGLILIGLLENSATYPQIIWGLAGALVAGRYMHGLTLGKFEGKNPFRFWGTILTWLSILAASIIGLFKAYFMI